jgi:ribonuclease-3
MSKKRELEETSLECENPPMKKTCTHSWIPPLPSQGTGPQASAPSARIGYNGHPDTLPKLPEILDKSLEIVTFTHQGTLGIHDVNNVNMSYDRLEFFGDAYLELIATRLLFPRFPNSTAGQLSQRRQLLVNNETLADFSLAYGFDTRAKLPQDIHLSNGHATRKIWTKTMGDIFEAYVAAVILSDPSNGFSKVEAWMTELWELTLSNRDEDTLNRNAKAQLGAKIMGKGVKIVYRDEREPEMIKKEGKILFHIGAYISGWGYQDAHLGSGKGWNKTEAGNRAAAQALSAPLTAKIAVIKREFDMKTSEERKQKQVI